jgi:hypothetical protein
LENSIWCLLFKKNLRIAFRYTFEFHMSNEREILDQLKEANRRLGQIDRMLRDLPVKSNENLGDWLTEEQARELLQRGATSLWDLRKRKKLITSRIGNRIYYSRQSILDFIEKNKTK